MNTFGYRASFSEVPNTTFSNEEIRFSNISIFSSAILESLQVAQHNNILIQVNNQ